MLPGMSRKNKIVWDTIDAISNLKIFIFLDVFSRYIYTFGNSSLFIIVAICPQVIFLKTVLNVKH